MITTKWFKGNDDLIDAHTIRAKVFIKEQKIAVELEMDNKDNLAHHIVLYHNNKAIATGRLLIEDEFTIGRVAVLKEERGNGYGDLVVRLLIRKAFDLGATKVVVHSQVSAAKFYEKIGFIQVGEEYIEEGTDILHINMVKNEDVKGCQ